MSNFDGEIHQSIITIRVLRVGKPTFWYADQVGKIVKATKREYVGVDGSISVSYLADPVTDGSGGARHYSGLDIAELK